MSKIVNIVSAPLRLFKAALKVVLVILVTAIIFIAAINAYVWFTTKDNMFDINNLGGKTANAIVVPGASVLPDGSPSTILKDRLDAACALYNANAAPLILVSGASSEDGYCEAQAMANYLVSCGVPEERIVKDFEGASTYATMYRAKNVFGYTDVIIASQAYHLPRCVFCAQGVGMNALGTDSSFGHTYTDQLYYNAREVFSCVKATFEVIAHTPAESTELTEQLASKFNTSAAH